MVRRRLPSGIVGAIFCPKLIVVDDRVSALNVLVIAVMAVERCRGVFAVVLREDLEKVLSLVA